MKLLINNAIALNKLNDLQLLYPLFSIRMEMLAEAQLDFHLKDESSIVYKDLLLHGKIKELAYTAEEMTAISILCKEFPQLSFFESMSLYLARRESAALLATHLVVRDAAATLGIVVYGYNWVFDQLHFYDVFSPMDLFTKWKALEKQFYSSTDSTMPGCVEWFYEGNGLSG